MISVEISDVLRRFEDLIARVEGGETVTITRDSQPVAEMRPAVKARESGFRPWGLYEGQFTVPDNFNDPLPNDLLDLFEGKGDEDKGRS